MGDPLIILFKLNFLQNDVGEGGEGVGSMRTISFLAIFPNTQRFSYVSLG